ncbi:Eyes absent [Gossypium arboreum]|uniref:Eyes absent n=1 Tax=Gossypium arboreum TaxID=29729 RepID=A0A0B0N9P1_GOSAR|nr:Eyes absent [Gossypium arboreum]
MPTSKSQPIIIPELLKDQNFQFSNSLNPRPRHPMPFCNSFRRKAVTFLLQNYIRAEESIRYHALPFYPGNVSSWNSLLQMH